MVKEFYSEAVGDTKEDILNPVCYADELIGHIPEKFRFRGYGCGSPIVDANIGVGEHVVDLGCGGGWNALSHPNLRVKPEVLWGSTCWTPCWPLPMKG